MTTTLNVSAIDLKARTATSLSDHLASVEDKIFTKSKRDVELQNLQIEIDQRKAAFTLSHVYAVRIFWLVFSWLAVVLGIIIWQGIVPSSVRLSNTVLITLLSTTTINMIGLLIIVIKYVFNHRLKI
jgi:hypothetical protein